MGSEEERRWECLGVLAKERMDGLLHLALALLKPLRFDLFRNAFALLWRSSLAYETARWKDTSDKCHDGKPWKEADTCEHQQTSSKPSREENFRGLELHIGS